MKSNLCVCVFCSRPRGAGAWRQPGCSLQTVEGVGWQQVLLWLLPSHGHHRVEQRQSRRDGDSGEGSWYAVNILTCCSHCTVRLFSFIESFADYFLYFNCKIWIKSNAKCQNFPDLKFAFRSNYQPSTQIPLIYFHKSQRKPAHLYIEEAGTSECLKFFKRSKAVNQLSKLKIDTFF